MNLPRISTLGTDGAFTGDLFFSMDFSATISYIIKVENPGI